MKPNMSLPIERNYGNIGIEIISINKDDGVVLLSGRFTDLLSTLDAEYNELYNLQRRIGKLLEDVRNLLYRGYETDCDINISDLSPLDKTSVLSNGLLQVECRFEYYIL